MVKIIGISGTTKYLEKKLKCIKLEETDSFNGIKDIKENYSELLANKYVDVKRQYIEQKNLLKEDETLLKNSILKLEEEPNKVQKREEKNLKKIQKSYGKLDKKEHKELKKTVSKLNKAKKIIEKNEKVYQGSIGEEAVIIKLCELSDSYYLLNDVRLILPKSVYWKKHKEYVRSSQIDHILVGPNGIFLIETKNWNPNTMIQTNYLPHKQIDRASLIFYLLIGKHYKKRKLPVYNIVVTLRKLPKIHYDYVNQLSLNDLNSYILNKQRSLSDLEIEEIIKRIKKSSGKIRLGPISKSLLKLLIRGF